MTSLSRLFYWLWRWSLRRHGVDGGARLFPTEYVTRNVPVCTEYIDAIRAEYGDDKHPRSLGMWWKAA